MDDFAKTLSILVQSLRFQPHSRCKPINNLYILKIVYTLNKIRNSFHGRLFGKFVKKSALKKLDFGECLDNYGKYDTKIRP